MELSGSWRAAAAHDELRRTFHEPQLDDRAWHSVEVPGHWAQAPELADEREVLHRFRFEATPPGDGRRAWLDLAGVCQLGDVWLDGAYVGDTEGYFVPHSFEITNLLRQQTEHLLAIDVACPSPGDPDSRTHLLGAHLDPDLSGAAGLVPGGIWRPITIRETGRTAIKHFRALCLDANPTRARITMRCVFDTPSFGTVVLRTTVAGLDHEFRHPAAEGENRVEWTFDVPDPELWWPHSLGEQPLHDLTCDLVVDDAVHDHRSCRIGFRSVRMNDWVLTVNDTRMFLKGVSLLPTTPRPGDADAGSVTNDVLAARDAGLDLIRCHTHIARPELYDAADQLGILVWQDFPMRGLMARGVRTQAVRQIREAVDLLAHHPSVAIWCAHDEPHRRPDRPVATPPVLSQQLPSWNRTVLDGSLKRVIERTDGSRPIVAHTGVPPHLPQLDGTTSSLWFGWHGGRAAELTSWIARFPRMGRFVSAFGAATVDPMLDELCADEWPAIDWKELGALIGVEPSSLQHLAAPHHDQTGNDWARLTEVAQANIVRTTIEQLRRLKYRPTGGFILHCLADATPSGGFGVLDRDRNPKPAWDALVAACRPVVVLADPLPPAVRRGDRLDLAIHVVSDEQRSITDAVLTATATIGDHTIADKSWAGPIQADGCSFIGKFEVLVPLDPASDGDQLKVALHLESDEVAAENSYASQLN